MAELAKNAVDSVLGTIGTAIGDEAKRLGSVRRDMQFIKDEMESMNGFLLDVADPADQSNQVRAWMKQVREVAYHSQSCIDRYVQTVGAGRPPAAGLLGSVRRVQRAVLTVRDRHHIATQIREIRSRAQEVGERRQRYGVQALGPTQGAARLAQEAAEDDVGRRHALAGALRLLDTDEPEVMAWLTGGGDLDAGPRMPLKEILSKFLSKMFTSEDLQLELATTARQVLYNKDPENVEDADAIISEQGTKMTKMQERILLAALKEIAGLRRPTAAAAAAAAAADESHKDGTSRDEKKEERNPAAAAAAGVGDEALELMKTASNRAEFEQAERQYSTQLTEWLKRVFSDELIQELVLCNGWLRDVVLVATTAAVAAAGVLVGASKAVTDILSGLKSTKETFEGFIQQTVNKFMAGENHTNKDDHVSAAQGSAAGTQAHETPAAENSNHPFRDILSSIAHSKFLPEALCKGAERLLIDLDWLDKITSHSFSSQDRLGPRLLAIVAPPADVPTSSPEEDRDQQNAADRKHPATKIARRVYTICREAEHFEHVVWIDAGRYRTPTERLRCLLKEVSDDGCPQVETDDESLEKNIREILENKIRASLQDKTFLIVLAGHEDEAPWEHIVSALPKGKPQNKNTIIVTPVIHQPLHFHGWYIASWLFVLKASRYKVHFYSHIEALSKKANELMVDAGHKTKELHSVVKNIFKKCRWDDEAFSSKLFLRALYANPRRSENELVALQHELEEFSTQRNNTAMIWFCYRDLPIQYQSWLKYLSMFPQDQGSKMTTKIRRGSLLRRWAAENQITSRGALDEAERGLNALVDRGLVLLSVNDCGPDGKPKYCELHRHVLTFITEEIRLEDGSVRKSGLPPKVAHRLTVGNGAQLQQPVSRRGHAPTCFNMFWRRILSRSCTTTPMVTAPSTESQATILLDEAIVFLNSLPASLQLGLIKVLDLEGCCGLDMNNLRNICNKIFQLKYLSLRNTQIEELPYEIGKLQVLETLDVRETKITSFPRNINELQKLMHLLAGEVHHRTTGSNQESVCTVPIPGGIRDMTNVQVLSHVKVSDSAKLEGVGYLQQLRKLGVVVVPCKEDDIIKKLLQEIGKLDECLCSLSVYIKAAVENLEVGVDMNMSEGAMVSHPRSLQSLNINGKISGLPTWIKMLHRLSRIILCRTSLKGKDIKLLGELVNLRTLVLRHDSCEEDCLSFMRNEFRQLELLVVEGSRVNNIKFFQFAAPKLEKVVWKYEPTRVHVVVVEAAGMEDGISEPARVEEAVMEGISKLPSLKEIDLTGKFNMNAIKKQMHENRNHPILTVPVPENKIPADKAGATAAGSSMDIPGPQ